MDGRRIVWVIMYMFATYISDRWEPESLLFCTEMDGTNAVEIGL